MEVVLENGTVLDRRSRPVQALRYIAGLTAEARRLYAKAEEEKRDLTAEERARDDRIAASLADAQAVLAEINLRMEEDREASFKKPTFRAMGDGGWVPEPPGRPGARHAKGRTFAEAFPGAMDDGGFATCEEFLRAVHTGLADPRLVPAATSTIGDGSSGGFLVPVAHSTAWLDASLESEIVRPRADFHPMETETKKVAGLGDLDNSTTGPLGLTVQWLGEGASATDSTAKARLLELKARKLACYVPASNELIADGGSFENMLGQQMIRALGWGLDYAYLNGTGVGEPLGALNDPAKITVSKETGQLAATIVYENLANMYARLHPACIPNSVWVANSTTVPQLLTVQIGTGASGTFYPVLKETNGAFTMLGRPVLFTEKVPALGTVGDIILADFSQYACGVRKDVTLEKSLHVGWQTDTSSYRAILRADGQGKWPKVFTPKNGSTLSWVVALATRA